MTDLRSGLLRALAHVAAVLAALGSLVFILSVGHHAPCFLLVLFAGWALSPFVALVVASKVSKRWSALTRAAIHWLMLVLAAGSLAIYGYVAYGPPRPKPAFAFLMVPLASWVLIAVVVPLAGLVSRRRAAA